MRQKRSIWIALLGALLATATTAWAQRLVTPLESNLETLTSDFNARKGKPRLVVILSPT